VVNSTDVTADAERSEAAAQLKFRDARKARALADALGRVTNQLGRAPVSLMHVCGSHEQAIAKFGLRFVLPKSLNLIMGPGCPVCVTDAVEVDEGIALALQGVRMATYGDMLRVPGTSWSLADAQARGARIELVYSVTQAVELARREREPVVFFATGFETTAVATAAAVLDNPPPNFSVLSAHKYVPPAMDVVAGVSNRRVEGFLAAGHAAIITGSGVFDGFVARHKLPVVVAGFEPLDILAALVRLVELVRDHEACVVNMYPRCVTREGNLRAQTQLWRVFQAVDGPWRGIGSVAGGNLRLRREWAHLDARERFTIDRRILRDCEGSALLRDCICGAIMAGTAVPTDCRHFGVACVPGSPVGACMVSSEGTCRIWHEYGGHPDLGPAK
jgi:hydrogenase expression/formation protein HypD